MEGPECPEEPGPPARERAEEEEAAVAQEEEEAEGAPGGLWRRQQRLFREFCRGAAQGPRETCLRIRALCQEWLQPQRRSRRRMLDLVVLEQFLKALPPGVEQRVRRLGPRTSTQAAALAEGLLRPHPGKRPQTQGSPAEPEAKEDRPSANRRDPPDDHGVLQEGDRGVGSPGNEAPGGDTRRAREGPLRPLGMETAPSLQQEQDDSREDPVNLGEPAPPQKDPLVPLDLHLEAVPREGIPSPSDKEAPGTGGSNEDEESEDTGGSDGGGNSGGDGIENNRKTEGLKSKADESQQTHGNKCCVVENNLLECSIGGSCEEPERCADDDDDDDDDDDADLLLVCSECGKCFARQADLAKHERTHLGGGKDPKPFARSSDQAFPISEHPYKCAVCGNAFEKHERLARHQRKHEKRPFPCSECKRAFGDAKTLQAHQRMYKNTNAERGEGRGQLFSLFPFQNTFSGERTYKCTACRKRFKTRTHLQAHQRIHASERPPELRRSTPASERTCEGPPSGKDFPHPAHLQARLRIHAGQKRYGCSECPEGFAWREPPQSHPRNRAGEKPNACPDCGKSFAQISHLRAHQAIHVGQKPFKCSDCGESFARDAHLKAHQRTHTGEKPYKCSVCGKSFSRSSEWKEHKRIHAKEKPYKCLISGCGKGFCRLKGLKQHQKNLHWQSTGPKE